jgi:PAS domain S-box-containing protein
MNKKAGKTKLFYVLTLLSSIAVVVFLSYSISSYNKERYIDEKQEEVLRSYSTVYNQHKNLADIVFKTKIDTKEILEIFKQTKDHHNLDEAREKLYEKLLPVYELLKEQNIRQLHFHLPDNKSFLRFHRPSKYGDDLTNIRETVAYVNKNKKPINGFEEGRIFNGYRFVYPLFYNYEHIGSVEISFNALAFFEEFFTSYNRASNFFVLKSVVESKTFESEKSNYVDSPLKDFYLDEVIREKIKQKMFYINLNKVSESKIKFINKKLLQNETYSFYSDEVDRLITVIPVKNNITNKVVAGFITAQESVGLKNIEHQFYINVILFTFVILLITYTLFRKNYIQRPIGQDAEDKQAAKQNTYKISLFNIVGVLIVFGVLLSVSVNILYSYKVKKEELKAQNILNAKSKVSQLVAVLPHFIESYETYEYEKMIKAIMDKDTVAIVLKNYIFGQVIDDLYVSGKVRVGVNEIVDYNEHKKLHKHLLKTSDHKEQTTIYSHNGKRIADLEIYVSEKHVSEELSRFLFSKIVESFTFLVVLILVVFGILYYHILKPIKEMISYISDTNENKLPKHKIPQMASKELNYLGSTINDMVEDINTFQNELESTSEKLEEQSIKYQNLLYSSSDAVMILDEQGKLVEYSYSAKELLGYSEDEMYELSVYDWDKDITEDWYHQLLDDLESKNTLFEREHTRKDGTTYIASISATKVKIKNITYLKTSVRDVSKQKRIEQELIDAKESADKASQAKSEFLANMSHEIRTPLNGIIGLTDIVLQSKLEDQQKEYLQRVKHSSSSLLSIINDILDYSKIEAGKLELIKEKFNIEDITNNLSNLFGYEASKKGLSFNIWIDPKLEHTLIGDSLRISQVLTNFIGNAMKFTHDGFVSLDIKLLEKTTNTMSIRFSVKDSGIGIAKGNQHKLFQAFNQEDGTTTKQYGGTGLGLAISKQLVDMMGGNIEFESVKGKGSKFEFVLPLGYTQEVIDKESETLQHIKLKESKKALVVEDNETNQIVAKSVLEDIGFGVELANDGYEGVKKAKQGNYDMVFMDLQMPNMDGFEATKKIREFDTKTPIIALSAAVMARDKELTRDAGMDDHLSKPIVRQRLQEVVERYFETQSIQKDKQPESENLPKVEGIDFDSVLEMVNGEHSTLVAMYERFVREYSDIEKIQNLSRDSDEFVKYIHKLKGVSGNLKIDEVFKLASKINNEAKVELTDQLIETTRKVCQNIQTQILPALNNTSEEFGEIEDDELKDMIYGIITDMKNYIFIKSSRVSNLLGALKARLDQEQIRSLQKGFDDIDNERVIKELNKVLEVIG